MSPRAARVAPLAATLLFAAVPGGARATEPPPGVPAGFVPPPSIHQREWLAHRGRPLPEPALPLSAGGARLAPESAAARRALTRTVFGFMPYWKVADLSRLRWDLLSHVAYFSVDLKPDGSLGNQTGSYAWPSGAYVAALREAARANGVKVVLVATSMTASSITSLLSSETARRNAIESLKAAVLGFGDGVNVDMEGVPAAQKANLVTFVADLAAAFHAAIPGSHVSLCTPAVDWSGAFDYDALAAACDGLFIMAYDYHWRSGSQAGPVSPLAGGGVWGTYNVTWTVNDYLTWGGSANRSKLILGLPFYGYEWPTASTGVPSSTTGAGISMTYDVARVNAAAHGRLWDGASLTPYYVSSSGGVRQGWYDDAESLGHKWDLVAANDLGGTGIWALNYNTGDDLLWDALRARFAAPPPCSLDCSASAPESGEAGVSLPFASSATPSGCEGPVRFAWDFGDGLASGTANPGHAYASAGIYDWSFTASAGTAQCRRTGRVVVVGATPSTRTSFLPSSAFRAGKNLAEFRTDVRILNRGFLPVTVTATLYDQATGAAVPAEPFEVPARSQVPFDNALASLFGRTLEQGAFGPIRFESTGPIVVSSSVNNVNACGSGATSGQWLPGLEAGSASRASALPQLAVSPDEATGYRTNLVVVNPGASSATATVRVRAGDGALLSTATIGPLPPNGFRQVALDDPAVFPGIAGRRDANLWAEVAGDAPVLAYASVIHNGSGDPFAVVASPDEGVAGAGSWFLPSSAFRAGKNLAEFRTDVRLLNLGAEPVTVTPTLYDQAAGEVVTAAPFPVPARSQASFDNALASLFGRTLAQGAFGPIRFESTGPIVVSSSVNNVNACGNGATSGQWLPGLDAREAMEAGVIPQLAVSSVESAGYRTNLVVVNPSSSDVTVSVNVRAGDGALLSGATIGPLPPNGFRQVALDDPAVFPGVAGRTDANLWVELSGGRFHLAYASVIHNASGDPFAVVPRATRPEPSPGAAASAGRRSRTSPPRP